MVPALTQQLHSFRGRVQALRNLPPVLKLVWKSGPLLLIAGVLLRLFAALVPVSALWVGKLIINAVWDSKTSGVFPHNIWILLASEFLLAIIGNICGRAI